MGQLLEHSRVFRFENAGNPKIYMGSADWMPRNLERRVEILFPIEEMGLREKLMHILEGELKDTVKAHVLKPDGNYDKVDKRGKVIYNSQLEFSLEAKAAAGLGKKAADDRVFIPEIHHE